MKNPTPLILFSIFIALTTSAFAKQHRAEDSSTKAKRFVGNNQKKWDGWCPKEKAHAMMDLVFEEKPLICVEIGVYGGSSIFPTAYALKQTGQGVVYAIDPWKNIECTMHTQEHDPNYFFWSKVDLQTVYKRFCLNLREFNLQKQCIVMRKTSVEAADFILGPIDILHIDGNHSEESSFLDATLYLPKVRSGGYIWFDDINWFNIDGEFTTRKALDYLLNDCDVVKNYGDFALLKKH